jgi:hypothetical protein
MPTEGLSGNPRRQPGARRFVVSEIDSIRRRVLRDAQLASPTPRDLLSVLDLIAHSAYLERAPLPLGEETVRRWFGVPRPVARTG